MRRRHSFARSMGRVMPVSIASTQMTSMFLLMASMVCMGVSAVRPAVFDDARLHVENAMSPILNLVGIPFMKVSLFMDDVSGIASLQATNARLEQENARLREWYQSALLLEAENKSLRSLLNLKLDPQYQFIAARIIADSGSSYVKSLLVSVGKSEGVNKGQAVLAGEGLVGRIIESMDSSARVLLVTDMNSRVPVVVSNTTQHAVMAGSNTEQPKLIHLPQDSEIADGAHLITSGYGGIYPPGLPVGRVVTDEQGVKRVEMFADLSRMQYLRIAKTKE